MQDLLSIAACHMCGASTGTSKLIRLYFCRIANVRVFSGFGPAAPTGRPFGSGSPRPRRSRPRLSAAGHLEVVSASDGGRSLIADYRNERWGQMRTRWAFTVTGGKISRFETGQA